MNTPREGQRMPNLSSVLELSREKVVQGRPETLERRWMTLLNALATPGMLLDPKRRQKAEEYVELLASEGLPDYDGEGS